MGLIFMLTSSNGNISALLAICAGNSPVLGEFPTQRPVTRSFHVFFDLRLNKPLSKQSWGWWFETLSYPLWRHCNVADDIFKCIFFNQNICISINISPNFIPNKKKMVKYMLSTDTRFFWAEVVECPGYLYTLFSVLHFSLLFLLSFKRFYH